MTNLITNLSGYLLHLYSRIVQRTVRYQVFGGEHLHAAEAGSQPVIWTSWHGATMTLAGFMFQHHAGTASNMLIIVPDDWRGESLSRWAQLAEARTLAVSMEEGSLVAARRLLALVRTLQPGLSAYINPDGPDGPSRVPKPGVAYVASRAQASILPIGVFVSPRLEIPRWDRYILPIPFGRSTLVFGEPLTVPRKPDLAATGDQIREAIDQAVAKAKRLHN